MSSPTRFGDLNAVLCELTTSARAILGANFCAAYLQGSFALGDADTHSDVDFVIVTHDELSDEHLAALQRMHARIHALDVPWAKHLEGSYIPKDRLRRVDPSRAQFLYLDNGASELVWDSHCNTAVVRWTLREHGIVLAGPEPQSLIEPVSSTQLRAEALAGVREYSDWAPEPTSAGPMSRWKRPYLVLTFCRLLFTLAEGYVTSKREAGEWALRTLGAEWEGLVRAALDDRADSWARVHQPADPEAIDRTLALARCAQEQAARYEESVLSRETDSA